MVKLAKQAANVFLVSGRRESVCSSANGADISGGFWLRVFADTGANWISHVSIYMGEIGNPPLESDNAEG